MVDLIGDREVRVVVEDHLLDLLRQSGQARMLLPPEHKLHGAVSICPWHVAPLVESVSGVGPHLAALEEDVLNRLHCGFCKAVALRVIWSRELMCNIVFQAEFGEVAAKLRPAVTAD